MSNPAESSDSKSKKDFSTAILERNDDNSFVSLLNLLTLLVQNRIPEFHTKLELLSSAALEKNPSIKHWANDLYEKVQERLAQDDEPPPPPSLSAEKSDPMCVFVEKIMEVIKVFIEEGEEKGHLTDAGFGSLYFQMEDLHAEKKMLFQQQATVNDLYMMVRERLAQDVEPLPPSLSAKKEKAADDKRIDCNEIVYFDLEWKEKSIVEFGAVLVNADTMDVIGTSHTFIKPSDSILQSLQQGRKDRFTYSQLANAPEFSVACNRIYQYMNEKTWIGHNIRKSDVPRLRTAFKDAGRKFPESKYVIDTLDWCTAEFGLRTSDQSMSLEALAEYFGLGKQTHMSIDDCRLNHQIFMKCGSVLALERIYKEQDEKQKERDGDKHRRTSVRQRTMYERQSSNTF